MRISKILSKTAFLALLAAVGSAQAQVALNLTASRTSTTMPDGNIVPMWGWSCGNGAAVTSAFANNASATATLTAGAVTAITVKNAGGGYTAAPTVTLSA